jgi:hypothetical protein
MIRSMATALPIAMSNPSFTNSTSQVKNAATV